MSVEPRRRYSRWHHFLEVAVGTRVGAWLFVTVVPRIDRPLLRLSRGRISVAFGQNVCLLTTTGARSGLPRSAPVSFVPDNDRIILVASNGGRPRHPAWYFNLRAHPEAQLLLPGRRGTFVAREIFGEEREGLWVKAIEYYSGWEQYETRTGGREIPMLLLTPKVAGDRSTRRGQGAE
jgi:deazaflavin-dependent oxidoreductase (nitroreductase family)